MSNDEQEKMKNIKHISATIESQCSPVLLTTTLKCDWPLGDNWRNGRLELEMVCDNLDMFSAVTTDRQRLKTVLTGREEIRVFRDALRGVLEALDSEIPINESEIECELRAKGVDERVIEACLLSFAS